MRALVFALLVIPSVVSAQPGAYTVDPGAVPAPPAPPPKPAEPAKPNVIVVGPDGKVTYDANKSAPATAPGAGYYYAPDEPNEGFGYETNDQPGQLHTGATPELHVVRKGDTLWDICFYYFNDPWQWPKIWSFNPQITNPHWIYPGDLVRLLPRGMFVQSDATAEPEKSAGTGEPTKPDNLPPPSQNKSAGLKQVAFVEKSDLDKSSAVAGAPDEKELLTIGDSIYISYPANNPPKIGQRYSIYKPDNNVKSGGKDVGAYVRILGTVEIVSVKQDKKARGVITEANQEIERGAKIGPLMKQFKNVPPVPPKVDAQGKVVAMLTKDQLIGEGEVVFIDLGKASGIEVGNRMFVVRRGDAKPPQSKDTVGQDDRKYPARSLGQVVVVEVGDNISIALVTLSVHEMSVGDLVMMQKSQ